MFRLLPAFALTAFLATPPTALAQQPARSPRIGYVYPAGGQQGTTFQVRVGGQFLDGASAAMISGRGVQVTVIEHLKPMTQQQANQLREQMRELMARKAATLGIKPRGAAAKLDLPKVAPGAKWTAEDEKLLVEIRQKLATFMRRLTNPMIAETVHLKITVAKDAAPGRRDLRLSAGLGISNPLVFCVGQLAELSEPEAKPAGEPKDKAAGVPTTIPLPATLNGQILPGEVDRFRFEARRGQRLVVSAAARQLIPYLADAVPGWFQATLAIRDAQGHELAYAGGYRFHPDPLLAFEVPADGPYTLEIHDSLYRGREDFVYRITVGELPMVTSIFPLGGRVDAETTVALSGWNLPKTTLTVDGKGKSPGLLPLSVSSGEYASNRVPFLLDTLPECTEIEPNDGPDHAQPVTVGVIVNGRIDPPGDCDVFRFEGRAGQQIVAEVQARRLGSPLDSVLKLTDAAGRQLAANDDYEDKASGLLTHHADSWLTATLPSDGTYYLYLNDAQRQGGPEYGYRLRIGPPRPDFELRVVPSSVNVRPGTSAPVTVHAIRRDGFSGEIALALKAPPPGFALVGGRVPAGQDSVRATLAAPRTAREEPLDLRLVGRATIEGHEVTRPALPAEDMMQAFAYRHLVPAQDWKVAVSGRGRGGAAIRILGDRNVKIPAGGTARLRVSVPNNPAIGKIDLALSDPPEGIAIKSVSASEGVVELVLKSDAARVQPGLKGNLIVTASAKVARPAAKQKGQGGRVVPLATLPAIAFEIVAPTPKQEPRK